MLFNKFIGLFFLVLAISIAILGDLEQVSDLVVFYGNLIITNIWFATKY